jgi:chloramphenicol-sensitive protein RarD
VSLGYFINPLVSVLLGVLFLRERRGQRLAVAVAATGVLYLAVTYGAPPWIALAETALLLVPALLYLIASDRIEGLAAHGWRIGARIRTGE